MTNFYTDKKVLVAVTGGIAAYKATSLVRSLVKDGAQVRVMMTLAAQEFITAKTLAVLSGNEVLTDQVWGNPSQAVTHVDWARWADLILVVPATANVLAKLAHGLADDVVTTTLLASRAPKVVAPAMNDGMWENLATQRNIKQLIADGVLVIQPNQGLLAEGYAAVGRLPEPEEILNQAAVRLMARQNPHLQGKKVLITAGPTRETIDPVRYLTNRSSGKMGYALAQAAAELGADVTLITTVARPLSYGINRMMVADARQMLAAVEEHFPQADYFISAAAVADFRVASASDHKIKKQDLGSGDWQLSLVTNPDILSWAGHHKRPNQVVVGFAAETDDLLANAQNKLQQKGADLIVANDVGNAKIGFDSDENAVTLLAPNREPQVIKSQSKLAVARLILARLPVD
ncbi:bifunctional phosphopantothenoylcysteine decarboxylase/phosphopantothenate--cysteine ligase CoaBC [Leuconostocaceae bacterium ESL0723]|nr:bifunctional phosphopantothenoylcysteine decarboxylase/phosphopantothenate--cysteine ligase CoaBC [Leuconostocaceae bacterium ESL0723]